MLFIMNTLKRQSTKQNKQIERTKNNKKKHQRTKTNDDGDDEDDHDDEYDDDNGHDHEEDDNNGLIAVRVAHGAKNADSDLRTDC